MANGGSRNKVIGMGTIKIEMFGRVVQVFGDVSHVPNLRMNFLSLSKLNILGYDFSTRNEFMKVDKG